MRKLLALALACTLSLTASAVMATAAQAEDCLGVTLDGVSCGHGTPPGDGSNPPPEEGPAPPPSTPSDPPPSQNPPPNSPPPSSKESAPRNAPDQASVLLNLVNDSRRAEGLAPLARHAKAEAIAVRHSLDMAAKGTIFHNSAYFSAETRRELAAKALGENVSLAINVNVAHQRLMNSPAHRANILDPRFNAAGFGVAMNSEGNVYVTEDFLQTSTVTATRPASAPATAARAPRTLRPVAVTPRPSGAPAGRAVLAARKPGVAAVPAPSAPLPEVDAAPPVPTFDAGFTPADNPGRSLELSGARPDEPLGQSALLIVATLWLLASAVCTAVVVRPKAALAAASGARKAAN